MRFCGFGHKAVVRIDAPPESRLTTLVCDQLCEVTGVEVVQALKLQDFECDWFYEDDRPFSLGCVPSLVSVKLGHIGQEPGYNVKWKLSDLFADAAGQIERLVLRFMCNTCFLLLGLVQIDNHVCDLARHKKGTPPSWQNLSIRRAFHVHKDVAFARRVMELAVNLEL